MKAKHDDLVQALDGMFDDHHGELAALLLDQIAFLDARITQLTARIAALPRRCPRPGASTRDGTTGPDAGAGPDAAALPAAARLAQIPGISEDLARAIIAETGLDMSRFPTAAHLVSWAGLCPSARQSGPRTRAGKKGQGNGYLRGSLGQAALGAARTATFLGERYHRIARRRGKAKAQVAVARSILVIIWHLLADPAARFTDLGPGYYQARTDTDRKLRNHIRQIQALGFDVTINQGRLTHTAPDQARSPSPGPGPLPRAHLRWVIFRSEDARAITGGVDTHSESRRRGAGSRRGTARDAGVPRQRGRVRPPAGLAGRVRDLALVGIEGTGSYGAGLARHVAAAASGSSRWTAPTGRTAAGRPSPTRWMRSALPGPPSRAGPAALPRAATAPWRRSGR